MSDPTPFDVHGPLPTGTTVLEASAGTGKTATIADLATRYVAEGVAELGQVMLVTFSRAATQELRERVRERLASAARGLCEPAGDDALVRLLADAPDADVRQRVRRLRIALSSFDAATIATTHGFCSQMLAGLGLTGDADLDATFVEDVDDLVAEAVDDLYLRKYAHPGADPPAVDHATARKVAREAIRDSQARLVPDDAAAGTAAHERYGMARAVRAEVEARRRARRLLSYDDLLTRLRDALRDPTRGRAACERVRARYRVVLVDEFQDTDPVQWDILRTAFQGHTTLVLIGDPKQAVYAFRGADLVTYLDASATATTRHTLHRNWRSDAGLLAGIETLFGGAALGDPRIVLPSVTAEHGDSRLVGAPSPSPLRLRVVRRPPGRWQAPPVRESRVEVARDLAADVVRLLGSGAQVPGGHAVGPGDLAVLVRTNGQAVVVRDTLSAAGVPAVLGGNRSVFLTVPAREWLVLLRAIEQPHRVGLVRAAALTAFLGWTARRLDAAGDPALDELGPLLRRWRDVLETRGVAALLHVVTASQRLVERMLGRPTGERDLTDLRHVAEALHTAAVEGQLGTTALVAWLARRVAEAPEDTMDERSRRLESDADAVQVVTIHGAKGLQFPVVYVPYAWNRRRPDPDPLRLHGPDGERLLDVGGPTGPGFRERRARHEVEDDGEELRLLYVALTRAQCQAVVWWAPSAKNTDGSALHRLLFGEAGLDGQLPPRVPVPPDTAVRRRLAALADRCPHIAVEPVAEAGPVSWTSPRTPPAALAAGCFDRVIDRSWRRTSYTALTAPLHDGQAELGSEPELPERDDEPDLSAEAPAASPYDPSALLEARLRATPSPLAAFSGGKSFGTLVHAVLETVDPSATDLAAELNERSADAVARRGATVDPAALAAALLPVLETPLGPLTGGLALRDVPARDRLAELDFELPLAGGDAIPTAGSDLTLLADAVRRHLPASDPMAAVADQLATVPATGSGLRGYLTGTIDAVLRVRPSGVGPRYLVVDYKTNALGDPDTLTAWDYRPAALQQSMLRAGYPLQALLYSVALHRFLRWRQPAYDPDGHLGGVLYLYLRGMCGPGPLVDDSPPGVFGWRPPTGLVVELSARLDRGPA